LLYSSLIKGIKSIYPYYYLDYQKSKAQEYLQSTFNWEYYGGHHFENIFTRFTISFWLFEKFAIDKRKITLSAQILSGEISRDEAIDILSSKPYEDSEKSIMINYVLKKLDLTSTEFEKLLELPPKYFYDYPSNYQFIDKLKYISMPFLKHVFIHKPQSIFQAEMRKEIK
jgi:hypothetical protein